MKLKKIAILLFLCVMVVGCTAKDGEAMDREKYGISVQEYTGVEYPALEKKARWEYIEQHRKDIEDKAILWVKESFGLDVKINHMYPTNGAAIATAEWLCDSNLKIKVVVGLDEKNERVSGVNPSMDAENNIMSYIVYKTHQEELDKLDTFLEEFCNRENLYGLKDEYIYNMGSFASIDSNYYYNSTSYLDYLDTYSTFIKNPLIPIDELTKLFQTEFNKWQNTESSEDNEYYRPTLTISLYSGDNELDDSIFKRLEKEFYNQNYLPDFDYAFVISENIIDTRYDSANDIMYPKFPTKTGFIRIEKGSE